MCLKISSGNHAHVEIQAVNNLEKLSSSYWSPAGIERGPVPLHC